ncbi:MAG: lysophospholipid acyltransferase family protein [Planctomycetes bacterium]|nr:lysophospholipid acyltransferase family protein [Planctomycetota bacterium]
MTLLRELRKNLTFRLLRSGIRGARRASSADSIERLRKALRVASRLALPLRRKVATNMELAGLRRPGLVEAHFERAIDQYVMMAHLLRAGSFAASGCADRYVFDDSFGILERAHAAGRGVIHIAPHICGYPLYGCRVGMRLPCRTFMRRAKDPRKWRLNSSALEAGEGHFVFPPEDAAETDRLKVAMEVVRSGKVLYITPDFPRMPGKGTPVSFLGRTAYFRPGAFIMGLRTGAPVVPVFWHWEDGAYRVRVGEPYELDRSRGIQEQAEAATRKWAADVDAFVREHPAMWWNWLDKRWTQILRGRGAFDPGILQPVARSVSPPAGDRDGSAVPPQRGRV